MKPQLRSFLGGAWIVIFIALVGVSINDIFDMTEREYLFIGIAIAVIFLFVWLTAESILLNLKLFRRFLLGRQVAYEGLWAIDLRPRGKRAHSSLSYAFASIEFDTSSDKYLCRGHPFSTRHRAAKAWRAKSFCFDKTNGEFLFTEIFWNKELPPSAALLLPLAGVGRLTIIKKVKDQLSGEFVDLDAIEEENGLQSAPVFDMHLYKVTRKDLREALGRWRSPKTDNERSAVARATLQRNGLLRVSI